MDIINENCPVFIFHTQEKSFPVNGDNNFNENRAIFYFHNKEEKYISYVITYKQDDGIHGFGKHINDIEFVRVFYEEKKYYLSQHSRDQGMYLEKLNYNDKYNRNIVYVALGTHAHYPSPGLWIRGFLFANDKTNDGIIWNPVNLIEITNVEDFRNRFGNGMMQWYADTKDLVGAPTGKILNVLYRFFYPISKKFNFKSKK